MTGKSATQDGAAQIMKWRQWIQPLQAARDGGDPPIPEDRLSQLRHLASDGSDAAFRAALLDAAKTTHRELKDRLAADFDLERDGAVYVGRHSLGIDQLPTGAVLVGPLPVGRPAHADRRLWGRGRA